MRDLSTGGSARSGGTLDVGRKIRSDQISSFAYDDKKQRSNKNCVVFFAQLSVVCCC